MEQEEYTKEEIDWSYIDFVDNKDVLELIEKVRSIYLFYLPFCGLLSLILTSSPFTFSPVLGKVNLCLLLWVLSLFIFCQKVDNRHVLKLYYNLDHRISCLNLILAFVFILDSTHLGLLGVRRNFLQLIFFFPISFLYVSFFFICVNFNFIYNWILHCVDFKWKMKKNWMRTNHENYLDFQKPKHFSSGKNDMAFFSLSYSLFKLWGWIAKWMAIESGSEIIKSILWVSGNEVVLMWEKLKLKMKQWWNSWGLII